MIKHFSILYVGQIELENVGRDRTPADARRYPNERLIESFGMAEELAVLMDELGFYALWTAEHHFQHEGYECFPNLILLGTYYALPKTMRWPISSPVVGSFLALAVAIIRAKWKRLGRQCWTTPPTWNS